MLITHFVFSLKPDGAATESSSNRERIVRNSSCQEFWNSIEIRDVTFEMDMGHWTLKIGN